VPKTGAGERVLPNDRRSNSRHHENHHRSLHGVPEDLGHGGQPSRRLIQGLNLAGVEVDRRMLAELAVGDINAFNALVKVAKDALPADINAPKA